MTPRQALISIRGSYWFVPALLVASCALLALLMVEVDVRLPEHMLESLPRLFGAGAEGSRAVLSAIATSTMTVAGVVFSINIVALSLATAQYSPHVLQNFIRDRANQTVLGMFLGIFTYCLIVLRTIRGGDENFVPGASIVTGILLALLGVALLIFFIHHVSLSIQISHIVSHIAAETRDVIERVYPEDGARAREQELPQTQGEGIAVALDRPPGYIEHIDYDALATIAAECSAVIRVPVAVGEFTSSGQSIALLHGLERCSATLQARVRRAFATGNARNIDQDVAFGLQQLVDIACRALSASNNDTTTALHALGHLTVLLSVLAKRDLCAGRVIRREGRVVLECARPDFADFVRLVALPFRRQARADPILFERLAGSLHSVGAATADARQLATVIEHLGGLEETLRAAEFDRSDATALEAALADATRSLHALSHARRRATSAGGAK